MKLLLDVGNTQTVVGIYNNSELMGSWRFSSKLFSTEDEIASLIQNFLKFKDIVFIDIKVVVVSSVVPELRFILERFGEKYFSLKPLFISSELHLPITIHYEPKQSVGADRISASVAAYKKYNSDLIVIDFGTATTFDVITKDAKYLGGVITLGIEGQINTLHKNASKLPKVSMEIPSRYIGTTTDHAIQSGVLLGHICMVQGILKGIKKELNSPEIKVIATGGLAQMVSDHLHEIDDVSDDLVLDGMLQILELNS